MNSSDREDVRSGNTDGGPPGNRLSALVALLGPGMLFAASAVGVSHLVQSTRAGANYGLTLAPLLLFACLVKYPAFRFGSDYGVITGESLLYGYEKQGRIALVIFAMILPVEMFIATAAVSLVTAGLILNIFGLALDIVVMVFVILLISSAILVVGKYRLLESTIKLMVFLFSIITLLATAAIVPRFVSIDVDLTPVITLDRATILFMIAAAGWMPTPLTASVFQSLWVCARQASGRKKLTLESSRFDFNTGYIGTICLALCFLLMGSALLYSSGITVSPDASGFAGQLIAMFSSAIGEWLYPVISLSALAVMVSTVITLLDAGPRAGSDILNRLKRLFITVDGSHTEKNYYICVLLIQVTLSISILLLFLSSFRAFIDFVTSAAFLIAPALAFFNHRAICDADIPLEQRPGIVMRLWSYAGIVIMACIALCYLYFKFLHQAAV